MPLVNEDRLTVHRCHFPLPLP